MTENPDGKRLAEIDAQLAGIDEDWGSPLADLVFVRRLLDAATLGNLNGGPARLTPQGLDAATSRPSAPADARNVTAEDVAMFDAALRKSVTVIEPSAPDRPTREMYAAAGNALMRAPWADRLGVHHDAIIDTVWDGLMSARPSAPGPSEADVERVAKALWDDWRKQSIAQDWSRDTTWDDLLRWTWAPNGQAASLMVAAGRSQARAALSALGQAPSIRDAR